LTLRSRNTPGSRGGDAHQRGVLRQSGAVYQFRHARLKDHLVVHKQKGSDRTTKEPGEVIPL